jgi:hypothetical protein
MNLVTDYYFTTAEKIVKVPFGTRLHHRNGYVLEISFPVTENSNWTLQPFCQSPLSLVQQKLSMGKPHRPFTDGLDKSRPYLGFSRSGGTMKNSSPSQQSGIHCLSLVAVLSLIEPNASQLFVMQLIARL